MTKISLRTPINEPFFNPRDNDKEWQCISDALAQVPTGLDIPMIIDGKKVFSSNKLNNVNPSNGKIIGTLQQADANHAQMAIDAALKAKSLWASLSPYTRIQKMRDLESVFLKWRYEMCAISMTESGFTSQETYLEWAELIDFIRFNNYFYTQLLEEQLGDGWGETNQLVMRPLKGFTCAVSPFNFPQAIGYNLPLAMALTGNTVVWKPSEDCTLSAYLLMLALDEVGFPPGVINMISGIGHSSLPTILTHPELSALNFTGSFSTARAFGNYIYGAEFPRSNFPRYVVETGGKDFLVADKSICVKETATHIIQGAFGRTGQKCSANSVLLPDAEIWDELKQQLVMQTQSLVTTDVTERKADLGPVISERQFDKIKSYLDLAKGCSHCKILIGGQADKSKGFYVEPTIIEVDVDDHVLLKEEIFGPVLAVRAVKNIEHAIKIIELHNYRLTGSVVSQDEYYIENAVKLLSPYAGNFSINRKTTGAVVHMQPFGGDGASGTNSKAGGQWYLLNFISQGTVIRRHARTHTPSLGEKLRS